MTRRAVEDGFELFLEQATDATVEEFSVSRALRGSRGQGGALVDDLLKNSKTLHSTVVEPEIERYHRRTLDQFCVVLDYVESDEDFEQYRAPILEAGPVVDSIRTDVPQVQRGQLLRDLLDHHRGLGEAVEPLLNSPESSFWDAATDSLSREGAFTLVSEHFAFTAPLRTNSDTIEMVTAVDPTEILGELAGLLPSSSFDIEYTDEALRAMYRAEQSVVRAAELEIDRRFE